MTNNDSKRVFLDIHGGDLAPDSNLEGALLALDHTKSKIVLVGDEPLIKERLKVLGSDESIINISFFKIDFSFVNEDCRDLYCLTNGRP